MPNRVRFIIQYNHLNVLVIFDFFKTTSVWVPSSFIVFSIFPPNLFWLELSNIKGDCLAIL